MIRTRLAAALVFGLLSAPALAHGPTPQQLSRELSVAAPAEVVWEVLRDPTAIAQWHPDVQEAVVEGEIPGAKRKATFSSGETLTDGIDVANDETKLIRWRLSAENHEALPVSFYTNTVSVSPEGEGAKILWRASFFRADTTNEPEERLSDAAAIAAMEAYVDHGLAGLKAAVEKPVALH